jgi:hypothetical protein
VCVELTFLSNWPDFVQNFFLCTGRKTILGPGNIGVYLIKVSPHTLNWFQLQTSRRENSGIRLPTARLTERRAGPNAFTFMNWSKEAAVGPPPINVAAGYNGVELTADHGAERC